MAEVVANPTLTDRQITLGRDYLEALRRLNFYPDIACWIDDAMHEERGLHLALVSPIMDMVPPFEIYELLFAAYDKKRTPRDIDPFDVSLYGSRTFVGAGLLKAADQLKERSDGNETFLIDHTFGPSVGTIFFVDVRGVYGAGADKGKPRRKPIKDYERFAETVHALTLEA